MKKIDDMTNGSLFPVHRAPAILRAPLRPRPVVHRQRRPVLTHHRRTEREHARGHAGAARRHDLFPVARIHRDQIRARLFEHPLDLRA